jgi:hypothetical protein
MPIPASRIAQDALVLRTQATGTQAPGTETPGTQATPPGAFGIFGMMISALIIIFAIVLLYMRSRNRR